MILLRVLVHASQAPGCQTLIRMLKSVNERKIEIVAVDMDEEAIGHFLAVRFYQVSPCRLWGILGYYVFEIADKESVDVFYVVSSAKILKTAENKKHFERLGCKVTVSNPNSIRKASNKYILYKTLPENTDVPVPLFFYPKFINEFVRYI